MEVAGQYASQAVDFAYDLVVFVIYVDTIVEFYGSNRNAVVDFGFYSFDIIEFIDLVFYRLYDKFFHVFRAGPRIDGHNREIRRMYDRVFASWHVQKGIEPKREREQKHHYCKLVILD
ncbi:hypothetical protein D3C86_1840730 [compost metagenome]